MYVPKSPQGTIFEPHAWLSPKKLARIEKSWAGFFQEHVLPLLISREDDFAGFYSDSMGAPNKEVSLLLGLLLLKELKDLSDRETVERFEFDVQWQYALETPSDEAHVCEKTLYNFRQHLLESKTLFSFYRSLLDEVIKKWFIKTSRHRLDSTIILSNMKILSRLGLFIRTIEKFLRKLKKNDEGAYKSLPDRYAGRYVEREGYFADPTPSGARHRLQECAVDLWDLVEHFRGNRKICRLEAYQLMERLLREQCMVHEDENGKDRVWFREPSDPACGGTGGECVDERGEVALKKAKDVQGDSLQNPSDPDATYSGHKGPGYKVGMAETCHEKNPFQVIDYVDVKNAYESDQKAAEEIHKDLKERDHEPETSFVDGGFVSGENIVKSADEGINLLGPLPGKKPEEKEIDAGDFTFDASFKEVKKCPGGHSPSYVKYDKETMEAFFDSGFCDTCPHEKECPAIKKGGHRILRIKRNKAATASRRKEEKSKEFKEGYKIRSGIEATISQLKNHRGMGHLSVRGSPSVKMRVVFKVLAENVNRLVKYVQELIKKAHKQAQTALA